jgi:hypothetical protein
MLRTDEIKNKEERRKSQRGGIFIARKKIPMLRTYEIKNKENPEGVT